MTAAALALAGCGRKGGLDLPPQPSAQPLAGTTAPAADPDSQSAASKGASIFAPSSGVDDGPPTAAKGRKKPFLLDPLLD